MTDEIIMTDMPVDPGDLAVELLRYMIGVEDTPCRLDHHGYCQEHPGGFRAVDVVDDTGDGRPDCWVAAARRVVALRDKQDKARRDRDVSEVMIVPMWKVVCRTCLTVGGWSTSAHTLFEAELAAQAHRLGPQHKTSVALIDMVNGRPADG